MKTIRRTNIIFLILVVSSGWLLTGCKDTEATHVAGLLETCKLLLNDRSWEKAIKTCDDVNTDEGKHLTAIAYMGRSGLTMADLLVELSDEDATPTTLIFSKIPETPEKVSDYKKALQLIMGEITTKDNTMYMEGILLSALLIFKELETLLGLSLVDGEIGTCAGDPADINNCDFAPTIGETAGGDPESLIFNGLGPAFYNGICTSLVTDASSATVETDTTSQLEFEITIHEDYDPGTYYLDYDVDVYGAPVAANSPLYYNKVASAAYAVSGTQDLSSLNFYAKMDNGTNFSIDIDQLENVQFCKSGQIEPPDAADDILNDCEILSFLEDPGF